ncbi:hypothetical protein [Hyphomicrobium sp. CS1GBMeth3]|uniref:hypothetical protein n=1 Tax=Hyphomicrobium sp. CS1GBMeth3 TaxID=1892845 RepID=UPI0009303A6B|nr:hypothetical protein [Hyphomicrobium sp. CS1GBMeth3]
MMPAAEKLVTDFEAAAEAARDAEALLRKSMAEEIARAERRRAFAFRRARLIRLLVAGATGAETEEAALAQQSRVICADLGFSVDNPAHVEILDRLEPVGKAVWQCVCTTDDQMDAATANDALHNFEAWFENARGQSFYVLFERPAPKTPLVDF